MHFSGSGNLDNIKSKNRYMDISREQPSKLVARAKAEFASKESRWRENGSLSSNLYELR